MAAVTGGVLAVGGAAFLLGSGSTSDEPDYAPSQLAQGLDGQPTGSDDPASGVADEARALTSSVDLVAGTWEGAVIQQDDNGRKSFSMRLEVGANLSGSTTYYLGDKVCEGSLDLVSENAESVILEEQITSGHCVGSGTVTLSPRGESLRFAYESTKANGAYQSVEGDLSRAN